MKNCADNMNDKVQPAGISNGKCTDEVQPISNEKCAGSGEWRMKNEWEPKEWRHYVWAGTI